MIGIPFIFNQFSWGREDFGNCPNGKPQLIERDAGLVLVIFMKLGAMENFLSSIPGEVVYDFKGLSGIQA